MAANSSAARRIRSALLVAAFTVGLAGPISGAEHGPAPIDPVPFAQVFNDNADGAMSILLARPGSQGVVKVTGDNYVITTTNPYSPDMAVVETPGGGFVYAWGNGGEIEFVILDKAGNILRPVTQLADANCNYVTELDNHRCAAQPSLAVTPDGHIAVAWRVYGGYLRYQYTEIWLTVLDHNGSFLLRPMLFDLGTNGVGCPGVSRVSNIKLAATEDNHFVIGWESGRTVIGSCLVTDIYWARSDSFGADRSAPAKLTFGDGIHSFVSPAVFAMPNNQVLIAYQEVPSGDWFYAAVDTAGSIVKAQTSLGADSSGIVGTQLSNGQAVLAWIDDKSVKFVGLDSAFNIVSGPTTIPGDPSAPETDEYYDSGTAAGLSATFDPDDHAILTWVEGAANLYSALVEAAGTVVVTPTIVYSSTAGTPNLFTSSIGQGNTTNHFVPAAGVDLGLAMNPASAGVLPEETIPLDLRVTNYGLTIATGIQLTATLDGALSYITDTSGITPTVAGNTVSWALPAQDFSEFQAFSMTVSLTSTATACTHYPIGLEAGSAQGDAKPADNTAASFVFVPCRTFLPAVYLSYFYTE